MRQRTGLANRRVQLQREVMTSDAEGFSAEAWTTLRSVWAHIEPLGAAELFQSGQTEENLTHTVTVRYAGDINPRMRIVYGVRVFFVHNVLDMDEAHEWITLLCKENVTNPAFVAKSVGVTFQKAALSGSGHSP